MSSRHRKAIKYLRKARHRFLPIDIIWMPESKRRRIVAQGVADSFAHFKKVAAERAALASGQKVDREE